MKSSHSYSPYLNTHFSTVLNTALSHDFIQERIGYCEDIILTKKLDATRTLGIIRCKMRLITLLKGMQILEGNYTDTDIAVFNREYQSISQIIEKIEEPSEVIEEVDVKQKYIEDNVYTLPEKEPQAQNDNGTGTEENKKQNVLSFKRKRARIEAIQQNVFRTNGEILSNTTFESEIRKIAKGVSDDPIIANLYYFDCLAANDEKFPDIEISDSMILQAIKTAKLRKDGAFVQSIKNNLIYKAQEFEKQSSPNTEKSLLLADHIKNLDIENPIIMNTVKYGICQIIAIDSIMKGDDASYNMEIISATGETKYIQILASACTVGDLSNDLVIRSIQSTIQPKNSQIINLKNRTSAFIKKGWSGIKNIFK